MWACVGACIRLDWGLYRALWGVLEGFRSHSPASLQIGALGCPCAIAFPRCFNKSVLRRFLGGLFGFIGFRCIFGWLVAFVALVGLYACRVKRLEVRKRKTCKFIGFIGFIGFLGFIGLLRSCGCFAWFVLLLLRSCSLLVVVVLLVALFPFGRYDKKKGQAVALVLSSFVFCCYSFANCSRASCHTFSASSGFSPQLFQCWRLAP